MALSMAISIMTLSITTLRKTMHRFITHGIKKLRIATLSMAISITTLSISIKTCLISIVTYCIKKLSIMTLSLAISIMTLSVMTLLNRIMTLYKKNLQ